MELLKWLPLLNFFVLIFGLVYTVMRVNLALHTMEKTVDELKKATANYNERLAIIETTCKLRAECEMAQARALVEQERIERERHQHGRGASGHHD
jgi:hypothetical protein